LSRGTPPSDGREGRRAGGVRLGRKNRSADSIDKEKVQKWRKGLGERGGKNIGSNWRRGVTKSGMQKKDHNGLGLLAEQAGVTGKRKNFGEKTEGNVLEEIESVHGILFVRLEK